METNVSVLAVSGAEVFQRRVAETTTFCAPVLVSRAQHSLPSPTSYRLFPRPPLPM